MAQLDFEEAHHKPGDQQQRVKVAQLTAQQMNEEAALSGDQIYIDAKDRQDFLKEYDQYVARLNTEIRTLENQRNTASSAKEKANEQQIQTQESLERVIKEREYHEKQFADGIISDTLGKAFLDLEYEQNEALIAAVSAQIPVEEHQLAAKRTEEQNAAVAGVNTYLDEQRWTKERRIPGITKLKEWKTKGKKEFFKWWDQRTDPERDRYLSGTEKVTRLDLVEDDYQRTINVEDGIDRVMQAYVTTVPGGAAGGNKTFFELMDAIPAEKELKAAIRNGALRHMVDVRYAVSDAMGAPLQVTEADRSKIMSRSWIDKGVVDGIMTDQGAKALVEAGVSQATIDKAKTGDKDALHTVKDTAKSKPKVFQSILGIAFGAVMVGTTLQSLTKEEPTH